MSSTVRMDTSHLRINTSYEDIEIQPKRKNSYADFAKEVLSQTYPVKEMKDDFSVNQPLSFRARTSSEPRQLVVDAVFASIVGLRLGEILGDFPPRRSEPAEVQTEGEECDLAEIAPRSLPKRGELENKKLPEVEEL